MYLDYANSVNKVMAIQGPENSDRFKESQRVLGKVKQKFRDPIVTMRVDMVSSTANKLTGNEAEAKALMEKVASDYALLEGQMGASIGPESRLEFANLLIDNGQQERAQEILKALAADYPDDEVLCKKIDRASSEPLSKLGKAAAIKLNREGKQLLQEKNFADAVVLFSQALDLYPNNIGLKLNLVLAQVQKMQVDGRNAETTQVCRDILSSVGELSSDSEFYKLYQTLKQSL